ncbi:MAG: GNAT family N-acetyltransferase [Hylemonella sp.]|nr:GNAT family N-acetyltransferase [Hylemonella sp.]MDP1938393.1 GNAT family N-acetyltransferase [Hylemonella sp.]
MSKTDYVIRVLDSPLQVDAGQWNRLLAQQAQPTPFMRHEYLAALHESGCATPTTGWTPRFVTLWEHTTSASRPDGTQQTAQLLAACPLYLKEHSYGEYVFDWAWANAYAQHGLAYYPKAVVAVPFTPVPGSRLLARDGQARKALLHAVLETCRDAGLSSLHLLFGNDNDLTASQQAGLMLRHTVQFHWQNTHPGYASFDDFLATLNQEKRKKIRQERRKVSEAGISFRWSRGLDITPQDWDFFYRCYERTYLEHGNLPYLNRDFFARLASTLAEHWLLFIAEREGQPIAASLIAVSDEGREKVAWGRYWGALERVDCLHFEACYYQPLQWCMAHGYQRFEGGAQGEHKLARALLPVKTSSAHWLAHPAFADAVERFLAREEQGVGRYLSDLARRAPFKQG